MSMIWDNGEPPVFPPLTPLAVLRIVLRAGALAVVVFGGLLLSLLLRAVERPFWGHRRPVTPWLTQGVCRCALWIIGLPIDITGTPMRGRGAMVANHSSWLDIFVLNACTRMYFVSKSEVAGWPGIGWLARATGTVFIERLPAKARAQTEMFRDRLLRGHKLMFFPEGTSTDGLRVLPFKTTLFESFFTDGLREEIAVQPVSVIYHAPPETDRRFYGWWGDMSFGLALWHTLAPRRQGRVEVVFHAPLAVAEHDNRKKLAGACEQMIRASHRTRLPQDAAAE